MQGETDGQIWHPEVIYSYRMSQALQIKAKLHFLKSFNFLTTKLHNLKTPHYWHTQHYYHTIGQQIFLCHGHELAICLKL